MNKTTCSVPDCERPTRLAGLCGAHHQRKLRHGDVRAHIPLRGQQDTVDELWCSACTTRKPHAEFYRNKSTKSGYDGICKACTIERQARQKVRRAIVRAAWREANRDRLLASKRAKYHSDPAAHNEAGKLWRKRNPEKVKLQIKAQNAARYARDKNAKGVATPAQIEARWDYYGRKCWMCGSAATDTDHVKPLAVGGSNWPANLRPACSPCNRSKSAAWPYPLEVLALGREATPREGAPRAA